MKYIIALGFCFIKYLKPMKVTISSNQMIDDFSIDEDVPEHDHPVVWPVKYYDEEFDRLCRISRNNGELPFRSIPKKFFFYEVSEKLLGAGLHIEVDCEDNNHTNGFMTDTSLHKLRMACILPKNFLSFYFESNGKHRATQRLHQRSISTVFHHNPNSAWPYNRKNWKIYTKSQNLDPEVLRDDRTPCWLGGKIKYNIPIIKKFGIKMLDPYHEKRYGYISSNFFCYKQVFEKYYKLNMCNEDN